ncbi:hypothetical protein C8R43DRAFT_1037685 [Mycena crocata]|nr:hypothetical protein C8R43DRAFT_1037685 [Mycena crocata]
MDQGYATHETRRRLRSTDLWFPDADLILLRAENTLFRVYSGILSARSSVFRDMVGFPQPLQPEGETVEGHQVVRLHDSGVGDRSTGVFESNL